MNGSSPPEHENLLVFKMGGPGRAKGGGRGPDAEHVRAGGDSDTEATGGRRGHLPSHAKPPPFAGSSAHDPSEYRDWKREITAIKASYRISDRDFCGMVFLATKGDARNVLWEIDPDTDFELDETYSRIMELLDKEFDRPEWEKADHAAEQFERLRRVPGQKMISYMRELQRACHKMLKADEGTLISHQSMARRVLRRSGLTTDEQRQVLSSCGHEYDLDKIKDALRLTYGDAHRDDHKRPFSRQGQASKGHQGAPRKKFFRRRFGAHVMEAIPEYEQDEYEYYDEEYEYEEDGENEDEWQEGDEEEEQDPDEEDAEDHEQPAEDEQDEEEEVFTKSELIEVLVQFLRPGKKLRSKSKGWKPKGKGKGKGKFKGNFSSSSSAPSQANPVKNKRTGKCMDCGQCGHWGGDPGCSYV